MTTVVTTPTASPQGDLLILASRLPTALRRVLTALGARIAPASTKADCGPPMVGLHLPHASAEPDWLDAATADDLLGLLRERESHRGAPDWVHLVLDRHRQGQLLNSDGSLELDGHLNPARLPAALLQLPASPGTRGTAAGRR
ncbi:MAG: hypothetical protein R6V11_09085 [Ectothiorhodospiraceae bacterium]